ncbi:MAG: response regulator [Anaeromyxobacteraceae bacterium]
MGDLARALLHDGVLTSEGLTRATQAAQGGDLASAALELGLADEGALARVLARLYECPGVELSRSAVPVANLDVVGAGFCRDHRVLPLAIGRGDLALAMADPSDVAAADQVRFVTGRKVLRHAAVGAALVRALDGVERARREGAPAWRGPRAPALPDPTAAHAATVLPGDAASVDLPDVSDTMEIVSFADLSVYEPPPPPVLVPRARDRERSTLRLDGLGVGKVALVADDDAEVRRIIARVLENLSCVVLEAGDGRSALAQAREAVPDLVVLDAMMPGMHGFEVCRAIRGDPALRAARVVLCSAVYRGTVGTDAKAAFGADAFLDKPFRLDELTRVLRVALAGPSAADAPEDRTSRDEASALWRQAADAIAQDRAEEAAGLARAAAAKDPWSAEAHYYLGHACAKLGKPYDAIAAYERAAELRPDVDAAHQCVAQIYERLGFQKSAREAWTRALETCTEPVKKKAIQAKILKLLGV